MFSGESFTCAAPNLRATSDRLIDLKSGKLEILSRILAEACGEMSRRDGAIVAWHEVPGTAPPERPSRRVRYDGISQVQETVHDDEKYLLDELHPIIPYPTGRFFREALSQALRARLRSHRLSGRKGLAPPALREWVPCSLVEILADAGGSNFYVALVVAQRPTAKSGRARRRQNPFNHF